MVFYDFFSRPMFANALHFHLMQNRHRIRAGYSPNSFFKAMVGHKTGCAVCAIYAQCAGTAAHRQCNRK